MYIFLGQFLRPFKQLPKNLCFDDWWEVDKKVVIIKLHFSDFYGRFSGKWNKNIPNLCNSSYLNPQICVICFLEQRQTKV